MDARSLLRRVPRRTRGDIIDVIPVDLVVAAILGVAAHGPNPDGPSVFHVASGVRNPLPYGHLVDLGEDWFGRHPLYDERGQPIEVVPEWSFPGRGRGAAPAPASGSGDDRRRTAPDRAARTGQKQAELAARLEDRHALAKHALAYVELYGAYTETDARGTESIGCSSWRGTPSTPRITRDLLLRPGRQQSIGTTTCTTCTFPRPDRRSRPGAHDGGPLGDGKAPRTGSAGPYCRPIVIWPSSTSSTR